MPAIFVMMAIWLVVNSLVTTPVESASGLLLISLGIPFYFYFRARLRRDDGLLRVRS